MLPSLSLLLAKQQTSVVEKEEALAGILWWKQGKGRIL
jgi:hypothetical protein